MNTTYSNILINYEQTMAKFIHMLVENVAYNKINNNREYIKNDPGTIGYVDQMRDNLSKTKSAIDTINTQNIQAYKTAAINVNPVGLDIPEIDYENDDDIKKYYKDLQTVVLDKFQEMSKLTENGEGWIKFIDTLSTPEEREENYKIPEFSDVYTQFVKEKKLSSKVNKSKVANALQEICEYNKKMDKLIEDADEFSMERSKRVQLYRDKNFVSTFEEFVSNLAECVFILEQDFLFAQSLEARKNAITETIKNAHEVLTGLSTHNPRSIKESALCRDINLSEIRSKLETAIENPDLFIVKEEKSVIEKSIDEIIDAFEENTLVSNELSLTKYKDRALKSNCAGIYIKNWATCIGADSLIEESISIFENVLCPDIIKNDSIERLEKTYKSVKAADKIISSGRLANYINEVTSPGISKAVDMLPFINKPYTPIKINGWAYDIEPNYSVTKEDVTYAVAFLENLNILADSIKIESYKAAESTKVYMESMKEPTIKVSNKDRLLMNINKIKNKIIADLRNKKISAKIHELMVMESQSRNVLSSAARAVSENDISENRDSLNTFLESAIELEDKLFSIINKKE